MTAGRNIRNHLRRGINFIYNYNWRCVPDFTLDEIEYYNNKNIKKTKKQKEKYCSSYRKKVKSEDITNITRNVLKQEIRTTPFTKLAEKYGISDNKVSNFI